MARNETSSAMQWCERKKINDSQKVSFLEALFWSWNVGGDTTPDWPTVPPVSLDLPQSLFRQMPWLSNSIVNHILQFRSSIAQRNERLGNLQRSLEDEELRAQILASGWMRRSSPEAFMRPNAMQKTRRERQAQNRQPHGEPTRRWWTKNKGAL
jgi:hypothetical protein